MRDRLMPAATMALAMSLAACGPGAKLAEVAAVPEARAVGVARFTPPPGSATAVALALDCFTGRITDATFGAGKASTRNQVLSPVSLAYAFAMLRAGARGRTARQIEAGMCFPGTGLAEGYNALMLALTATPKPTAANPHPPLLTLADALFADRTLPLEPEFLRTLAANYGAGVQRADLRSAAGVRQLNAWVKGQTRGRIPTMLDEQAPPDIDAAIVNAVYLKASWASPFGKPAPAPFTRADGTTITPPTLRGIEGSYRYAAGAGWQAVELPYVGGRVAMRIIVPTGATGPAALLRAQTLAAVASTLRPAAVDVTLPVFSIAADFPDLRDAFRRLGIIDAFDEDAANLSAMSPTQMFVNLVKHRANIDVNDGGTEAAAATVIGVRVLSARRAQHAVHADRPFAYEIVHVPTGAPIFVGQVVDPTQRS